MNISDCKICAEHAGGHSYKIYEDENWLVRHSNETNILGYCIIDAQRHFLDLSFAREDELASYGKILGRVTAAIRSVIDCERVYTFSLAEAVPHFHVHVIPRTAELTKKYCGRGIMSYPLSPAADPGLVGQACDRLRRALRRELVQKT